MLYANDLVLMSEITEWLRKKFQKMMMAFESMGLKLNFGSTKLMISQGITKDGLSKCKVNPGGICFFRLMANFVLYVKCFWWN